MSRIKRALTENRSETHPEAEDARLRGRTYAVPFDRVWNEALSLAFESPRWTVTRADDQEGRIEVDARSLVFRLGFRVSIRITLDEDAQTRLDMTSASRVGKADFGANTRRIARFLKRLDGRLTADRSHSAARSSHPTPDPAGA